MPQRKSGLKALRQNRSRRLHNMDIKTDLRKTVKLFLSAVEKKDKTAAQDGLKLVYKKLDKAAKTNLMHKNTVSRRKSNFIKALASIGK